MDSFSQWWEYGAHIDYIEKNAGWRVGNLADENSPYDWSPDMPDDCPRTVEVQP